MSATSRKLHAMLSAQIKRLRDEDYDDIDGTLFEMERQLAEVSVEMGMPGYARCPLCGTPTHLDDIKRDLRSHEGVSCDTCEDIAYGIEHFLKVTRPPPRPRLCPHGRRGTVGWDDFHNEWVHTPSCGECSAAIARDVRFYLHGLIKNPGAR